MRIVLKHAVSPLAAVLIAALTLPAAAFAEAKLVEPEPHKPLANPAATEPGNAVSGGKTLEALLLRYPDLGKDQFIEADLDGDGLLSPEELQAAYERGLLPA